MRFLYTAVVLACLLNGMLVCANAAEPKRTPSDLTLTLAEVADAGQPRQYLFLINGVVGYKTVDALKQALKDLPAGSKLTWAPGCDRIGDEPLLSSATAMKDFEAYCTTIGISFTLVPSG